MKCDIHGTKNRLPIFKIPTVPSHRAVSSSLVEATDWLHRFLQGVQEAQDVFSLQNTGMSFSFSINNIKHADYANADNFQFEELKGNSSQLAIFGCRHWAEERIQVLHQKATAYVTCNICKLELWHEESGNCAFGSCTGF